MRGAEPGDTLEVRIKAIELSVDWGWNVIRPLRGTLPEDFPNFRAASIPIDRNAMTAKPAWGPTIPLRPFFGIIAVAPRARVRHDARRSSRASSAATWTTRSSSPAPRSSCRCSCPARTSPAGDGHAVQGDGEVCLTALETCLDGTFELVLHKGQRLAFPRAVTPTHYIAMGIDPDLDDAAKQALRDMIRWLVELKGWKPDEAYVFCSLACDLHVTQLVDGNKGIHAMVARNLVD